VMQAGTLMQRDMCSLVLYRMAHREIADRLIRNYRRHGNQAVLLCMDDAGGDFCLSASHGEYAEIILISSAATAIVMNARSDIPFEANIADLLYRD